MSVDGNRVDDSGQNGLRLINSASLSPLPLSVGGNQVSDSGIDGIHVEGVTSDFDLDSPADCTDPDENNVVTGSGGQPASFAGTTGTICVNDLAVP